MLHDNYFERMISHMKILFDVTLFATVYLVGVFALSPDLANVMTNLIASTGGAAVLCYFRRDRDYREIFFKSGCAAICGYVVGALLVKYYAVDAGEYKFAIFFFSSLLSIFFIKGLLAVTEQNASGFIISIIQKFAPANGYKIVPTDSPNREMPAAIETKVKIKRDGEITDVVADKKTL